MSLLRMSEEMDQSQQNGVSATLTHPLVHQFFHRLQSTLLDELEKEAAQPTITLKRRPCRLQIASHDDDPEERMLSTLPGDNERQITYSWPGRTVYEAWKFTCVIRVLSLLMEAIEGNLLITKRSIYYDNPGLFGTQTVVNTIVDDIAYTIGVGRTTLNVISVGKGLAVGAVQIKTKAGSILDMTKEDALIPRVTDMGKIDISEVKWICVVEKEAIFRRLVHNRFHLNAAAGKGILITGKGYPDICTREFVHLLSRIALKKQSATAHSIEIIAPSSAPHFFALVDGDCDGLGIMSTYKYGSMAHAHASADLIAPKLVWLGTRITDVIVKENSQEVCDEDWVMISLSPRDVKKIRNMLARNPVFSETGPEIEWRVELQMMMILNTKVEIEILCGMDGGLEAWMDRKINDLSL